MIDLADNPIELPMQITITATYDDKIMLKITDKTSLVTFLEMELTREQFINATMNRLGNTEVKKTTVRGIAKVGKKHEQRTFEFPMPCGSKSWDKETAVEIAKYSCPEGWVPDLSFNNQGSFFQNADGEPYARTLIRRWVKP